MNAKLLDHITILKPTSCGSCPLGYTDPDRGSVCNFHGDERPDNINSPESAVRQGFPCIFISTQD